MSDNSEDGNAEELEGLDIASDPESAADYPLNDLMVRSEIRTVKDVISRIEKKRYVMNPDFQRDFLWQPDKQSKLIESCLMRIPLPVFYVAEASDGRIVIVDGLQRLSTFRKFLNNDLRLTGLGKDHPMNGKTFDTLPTQLQERVEDTQLTLYILDSKAPDRARLDIFERVNGGVPLNRQQMRNAIYDGPATRWLSALAKDQMFLRGTGNSLRSDTMRDREALNRFCAFKILGWQNYSAGDMDGYLAETLKRMNKFSDLEFDELSTDLHRSLDYNWRLFKQHAFRKSLALDSYNAARSVINIALFDVCSVLCSQIRAESIENNEEKIREGFEWLINHNTAFYDYISFSTNSTYQVRGRFSEAEECLREFLK